MWVHFLWVSLGSFFGYLKFYRKAQHRERERESRMPSRHSTPNTIFPISPIMTNNDPRPGDPGQLAKTGPAHARWPSEIITVNPEDSPYNIGSLVVCGALFGNQFKIDRYGI